MTDTGTITVNGNTSLVSSLSDEMKEGFEAVTVSQRTLQLSQEQYNLNYFAHTTLMEALQEKLKSVKPVEEKDGNLE